MSEELIDDYDDRSVADITDELDTDSYRPDELYQIREYEREHKNRSTLIEELNRRGADQADQADQADAVDNDEQSAASEQAAADDDEEGATATGSAETVTIIPRVTMIGGETFRSIYRPHEVELTPAVERAIDDGRAVLQGNRDEA